MKTHGDVLIFPLRKDLSLSTNTLLGSAWNIIGTLQHQENMVLLKCYRQKMGFEFLTFYGNNHGSNHSCFYPRLDEPAWNWWLYGHLIKIYALVGTVDIQSIPTGLWDVVGHKPRTLSNAAIGNPLEMGVSIGKSPINRVFSITMFDYRRVPLHSLQTTSSW